MRISTISRTAADANDATMGVTISFFFSLHEPELQRFRLSTLKFNKKKSQEKQSDHVLHIFIHIHICKDYYLKISEPSSDLSKRALGTTPDNWLPFKYLCVNCEELEQQSV